ncbi:flagellar hook-associated protein 1 [Sporosarcina luteola]|uniref:Flagellar hook-associated protein 1 n=1 Tax=Sporosarcina luteola TaxID=582850 RepID=A0A511Z6E5_9BACL|nr:flagellar hook-associated protein FlgK [Sporosarcina luteola]GEN83004.1 flagellar hook-associated protein 1 [Sporosarcina luteola]
MRSTFMGLETNKRGLYTQQSALYTTGHNISNANTLGYSRQRVNMQATAGFPGVGLNTPTMPGFLGTGVEAGSIQRIRDSFVDQQYRQESNKLGYWESRSKSISQMEDILNEPSNYGMQKSLSVFWQSLNDLAVNPDNGGARKVVIQRGQAVADSFNYMYNSLTEIQNNIGKEQEVGTKDINSLLQQIGELNRQISEVEPNGYLPNDLYDSRDVLLDQLSQYLPIELNYEPSGGRALHIAEGSVTVSLKMKNGATVSLVNGNQFAKLTTNPSTLNPKNGVEGLSVELPGGGTQTIPHDELLDVGKLKSLMNSYGVEGANGPEGLYPDMLAKLDEMALAFANKFNEIHGSGSDLNGDPGRDDFFVFKDNELTAGKITINADFEKDPSLVAASDSKNGKEEGNGNIAKKLAGMQFTELIDGATVQSYFQGIIGQLGVDGQQAEKLAFNTATLLGAVEHRRASISSVSLDEEMTNMIQFQQAYNASARMITVIDETLDKIINGMGVGGR